MQYIHSLKHDCTFLQHLKSELFLQESISPDESLDDLLVSKYKGNNASFFPAPKEIGFTSSYPANETFSVDWSVQYFLIV